MENHKVALFNGLVVTTNGLFQVSDITPEEASLLVRECGYISAVGHKAAASILSELLMVRVAMNRIQFYQQVGQKAIALKLNKRPDEGVVLDKEQTQQIGYCLKLIERLE